MHILKLIFLVVGISFSNCSFASYVDQGYDLYNSTFKGFHFELENLPIKEHTFISSPKWNSLPYEVFINVFDWLSYVEMSNARLVCRSWDNIMKDPLLSLDHYLVKKDFSSVLRKIGQSEKVKQKVQEIINAYFIGNSVRQRFYAAPDVFYKALLTPIAIGQILSTPKLLPALFNSNISAFAIYNALKSPSLDPVQEKTLNGYINTRHIPVWTGNIFSKEFLAYMCGYKSQYKACSLLMLAKASNKNFINILLENIYYEMKRPQQYTTENEKQALYFPRAILNLAMPPTDFYNISRFCYLWSTRSSSSTFKNSWQGYEKKFLYAAAAGNLPQAQYRLGRIAYNESEYKKAELFYRQASDQGYVDAQFHLGRLYHDQRKYIQAEFLYRQAAREGHQEAIYELGGFLIEQGRDDEAENFLYQAAARKDILSNFRLARVLFRKGNFHDAELFFGEVAKQTDEAKVRILINLLLTQSCLCERELFYRQLVFHASLNVQKIIGTCLLATRDLKQIDPYYRQVLNYGSIEAQQMLAGMLFEYGKPSLAEILLQEIEDQNNKLTESLLNNG
ncbi:MAG: F-box/SEL1-like repeat protein [Alphaproteobacteria bacterium]|nr:F-box/SEL1-like repeat protein [Alphaproteobacteria bacterium]